MYDRVVCTCGKKVGDMPSLCIIALLSQVPRQSPEADRMLLELEIRANGLDSQPG